MLQRARRILSALLVVVGLALIVFHVWLFWNRWETGRLADPEIAARWAGSVLLIIALAALKGRRISLVRGRQALVVWTLVAFVHLGAHNPAISYSFAPSSPGVLFVIPSVAGAALIVASTLLLAARSYPIPVRQLTIARRPVARQRCRPSPVPISPHGLRAPPFSVLS
jgi:hypothetical protein